MRNLYLATLSLLTLLCTTAYGQNVINAGGGVYDHDSVIHHISVGEPIISTTTTIGSGISSNFGFLQPFACMEVAGDVMFYTGKKTKQGKVLLYLKKDDNTAWRVVDSVRVDTNGHFSFLAFPDVEYVAKWQPPTDPNSTLLTSYASEAKTWNNADVWTSSCGNSITANIFIQTKAAEVTTPTVVVNTKPKQTQTQNNVAIVWQLDENDEETETVSSDKKFTVTGTVGQGGTGKIWAILGDPIPGIDVSLEQVPGGGIVAQTTTDEDGFYQFDDIAPGNYTISVDVPGVPQVETYGLALSSSEDTVQTSLNFVVDEGEGIFVEEPEVLTINEASIGQGNVFIYPNPFAYKAIINFDNPDNSSFEVYLRDISGKVVHTRTLTGDNKFYLDRGQLPSGMYLLRIANKTTQYNARVIIN